MKRRSTLRIGEVSNATMRPEDLIPSFIWELDRIRLTRNERQTVQRIARASDVDEAADYWSDEAHEDLSDLFDIMNNHCPDYSHFGAHEGDGACYGVWPSIESAKEDATVIEAGEPFPKGADYVMTVTDHGNCTLYRHAGRRWIEVWAVV